MGEMLGLVVNMILYLSFPYGPALIQHLLLILDLFQKGYVLLQLLLRVLSGCDVQRVVRHQLETDLQ